MDDKKIFILVFAVACVAFMLAINSVCKRMNEYEAEHGCKYTGFGLCETYY